jgi:AcrR family transcriptional regulator
MTQSKGDRTRERIIASAAPLFNQRGYVGASMADLMEATGLEKGGIYRHFTSKDELALAAFDHSLRLHRLRIRSQVELHSGAIARITALADAMANVAETPAVPGGCPLLNTAVEADDAPGSSFVDLRKRTRAGMRRLIRYAQDILEQGIESGELSSGLDAATEASMIVATMEGALMLSKLYDDRRYVRAAAARVARQAAGMSANTAPHRAHK